MTKYYPMMINITNKKCLVIGGGNVALRKITDLIYYGANITLVSREINEKLKLMVENTENNITYIKGNYKNEDIKDSFIVIAATNDGSTNLQIAKDCEKKDILVNIVDDLENSRFIVPSKVSRGDLTLTISTNGKCPFYSKLLRKKLETEFDDSYGTFVNILSVFRTSILLNIKASSRRKNILDSLDTEYYFERLKEIGEAGVRKELEIYARNITN